MPDHAQGDVFGIADMIRGWSRAAPRDFLLASMEEDAETGEVSVYLARALTKEKKKIVRDGARLLGYQAEIAKEKITMRPAVCSPESSTSAQSVPKRRCSHPR